MSDGWRLPGTQEDNPIRAALKGSRCTSPTYTDEQLTVLGYDDPNRAAAQMREQADARDARLIKVPFLDESPTTNTAA